MTAWRDAPRGEENVEARSRPQVKHDLSWRQLSEGGGIAAAQADRLAHADLLELVRRVGAGAAAVRSVGLTAACLLNRLTGGNDLQLPGHTRVSGTNCFSNLAHSSLLL